MAEKNDKRIVLLFVCCLFLLVLIVIEYLYQTQKENHHDYYNRNLHTFYQRIASQGLNGNSVFIGASLIQGFNTTLVMGNSLNFGIGQDTIQSLSKRIDQYNSIHDAEFIFLQIGGNDLALYTDDQIEQKINDLAGKLSKAKKLYWSALLPVINSEKFRKSGRTNDRILKISDYIKGVCNSMTNCVFVNVPQQLYSSDRDGLKNSLHIGDGLHLNDIGYRIWAKSIRDEIIMAEDR